MSSFARLGIKSFSSLVSSKDTHKAALLYAIISIRSNYSSNNEAYLGDYQRLGFSRQEYRTACEKLEQLGYAKFYKAPRKGTTAILLK